jgi:hypothetical protein
MRVFRTLTCWGLFIALAVSSPLQAQVKNPRDIQKSCRDFVQGFYDWYVPKVLKEGSVRASDLALKYKGNSFDSHLSRQLREDSEAQTKVTGEIVGLDFDPFLNSQDPDERYVAGKVTLNGGRYWVEVYAVRPGMKSEKPVVMPELARKDGRWLFVNFHYPNSERPETENLLRVLQNFREGRQKPPK